MARQVCWCYWINAANAQKMMRPAPRPRNWPLPPKKTTAPGRSRNSNHCRRHRSSNPCGYPLRSARQLLWGCGPEIVEKGPQPHKRSQTLGVVEGCFTGDGDVVMFEGHRDRECAAVL